MTFSCGELLTTGEAEEGCRASVVIPARDEEDHLKGTLEALGRQRDERGAPMMNFEVLLLLNNCQDGSAAVARAVARELRGRMKLHIVEREFAREVAHVGTARRMLMDTAWARVGGRGGAILSTDADSTVSETWVAENLRALERADVVGGEIRWAEGELERLPAGVRAAYERDRRLQELVTAVESWLDPEEDDPWPRHRHCFGASMACTAEVYARAGGLPPRRCLEDVAFVTAARSCGARVRHEPRVWVATSGRMRGRVDVGLSGQLREWEMLGESGQAHVVPSAAWIVFRARWAGEVRRYGLSGADADLRGMPQEWRAALPGMRAESRTASELVERFEGWIGGAFGGERNGEIGDVMRALKRTLARREDGALSTAGAILASIS